MKSKFTHVVLAGLFYLLSAGKSYAESPAATVDDFIFDLENAPDLSCIFVLVPQGQDELERRAERNIFNEIRDAFKAELRDMARLLLAEFSLSGSPGYNDITSDTLMKHAKSMFDIIVISPNYSCFRGKEKTAFDAISKIFANNFLALALGADPKLVQNVKVNSTQLNKALADFGEAVKNDTALACPNEAATSKFNLDLRNQVSSYLSLIVRGLLAQTITAHSDLKLDGNSLAASFERIASTELARFKCLDQEKSSEIVQRYFAKAVLAFALNSGVPSPFSDVGGPKSDGALSADASNPGGAPNPPPPDGGAVPEPGNPPPAPGIPVEPSGAQNNSVQGNAAADTPRSGCVISHVGDHRLSMIQGLLQLLPWGTVLLVIISKRKRIR